MSMSRGRALRRFLEGEEARAGKDPLGEVENAAARPALHEFVHAALHQVTQALLEQYWRVHLEHDGTTHGAGVVEGPCADVVDDGHARIAKGRLLDQRGERRSH